MQKTHLYSVARTILSFFASIPVYNNDLYGNLFVIVNFLSSESYKYPVDVYCILRVLCK